MGRALFYELAHLKILYIRQNGQISRLFPDNIVNRLQGSCNRPIMT